MQKILIPAAAIAGVILLVGLIVATGGSPDPAKPGAKGGDPKGGGGTTAGKFEFPLEGADWKELPGGVKYWDSKEGIGTPVAAGARVTMHYTLWLTNGERKQSSKDGGEPLKASLAGGLIQGWMDGVPGMKPGGTRRLFIPAVKGYGAQGKGDIPPNADLVFEVELISSP